MALGFHAALTNFDEYRLDAEFKDDCTSQKPAQVWKRTKEIGKGGFGTVFLETYDDDEGYRQYRAVKVCSKELMKYFNVNFEGELSALAELSKSGVSLGSRYLDIILTMSSAFCSFPRVVGDSRKCLCGNGVLSIR